MQNHPDLDFDSPEYDDLFRDEVRHPCLKYKPYCLRVINGDVLLDDELNEQDTPIIVTDDTILTIVIDSYWYSQKMFMGDSDSDESSDESSDEED